MSWKPVSNPLKKTCFQCRRVRSLNNQWKRTISLSSLLPWSSSTSTNASSIIASQVSKNILRSGAQQQQEVTASPKRLKSNDPLKWLRPGKSLQPRTIPITIHPQIPSAYFRCREPLKAVQAAEFARLDPTGARRKLFEKNGPEAIHVRDIVMVRTRTSDPFSGVVIRIQRKQHDSSILLRNTITGVGVEREFKIYSPNVTGIELVQRRTKKPAQTRLFYLRKPEHDVGSVDGIVRQYLRQKSALGTASTMNRPAARAKSRRK